MHRAVIVTLAFFGLLVVYQDATAGNADLKRGYFGAAVGSAGAFEMRTGGWFNYEVDNGLSMTVFGDHPASQVLTVGYFVEVDQIARLDSTEYAVGFGLSFKAFRPNPSAFLQVRPSLQVGYAYLNQIGHAKQLHFMTVGGYLEFVRHLTGGYYGLIQVGVKSLPTGGQAGRWISASPRFVLRAGLVF